MYKSFPSSIDKYFETLILEYDDPLKFLRTTSKLYLDEIEILNNKIHIINEQNDNLEEYRSKLIDFKEYSDLSIEINSITETLL